MLNLLTVAHAMGQSPGGKGAEGAGGWLSLAPIALMILIFYFLLIRPQQKREKERKQLIEAIQKGDKVLTVGGIYGTVASIKDENIVILKIADGTKVEFAKSSIQTKVS